MKCENCGAEYRMKDVCCPFCQSENPVLAEIRKEQILKNYDKELQRMRNTVPDKTMKKWTWRLVAVCGILAGVALLAGIVLAICAPIKARWDYQRHQRHEQRLEEMLAGHDIEGLLLPRRSDIGSCCSRSAQTAASRRMLCMWNFICRSWNNGGRMTVTVV